MAVVTLRGNARVLTWRQNGQLRQKTIGHRATMSDREAELIRKTKEIELASGQSILLIKGGTTFKMLSEKYLAWHSQDYPDSHERIAQIIRMHLKPHFAATLLTQVDEHAVTAYKISRQQKVKGATVGKEVRTLKAMFNKALDWGLINKNPIRKVSEPQTTDSKPAEYFTLAQLVALYNADPYYAPVWKLLANTGMRRSEALNLKWVDVKKDTIHILSEPGARTKSAKWRDVPISVGARAALEALTKSDDYVLPRVEPESLSRAAAKLIHRAELKGSLHTLRHTFITHMVMKGVSIRVVQVLAGHSTVAVTEKYAHHAPDHMQDVMKGLEL